jgi:hypothetical protein
VGLARPRCGGRLSAEPELSEEDAPLWVVLEVADPFRGDVDLFQRVQRRDGSPVDEGAVDSRPEPVCEVRVARLKRERSPDLVGS